MKKFSVLLVSVVLLACLLISCNPNANADKKAIVKLNVVEETSKSLSSSIVYADFDDVDWYYTATTENPVFNYGAKSTWTELEGGVGASLELSQGIWNFALKAVKRGAGPDAVAIYSGTTRAQILAQSTPTPVTVYVSVATEGEGYLVFDNIKLALRNGDSTVSANKAMIEGSEIDLPETVALEAGSYNITVLYFDAFDGIVKAEETITVTIYGGATTTISGNISEITQDVVIDAYTDVPTSVSDVLENVVVSSDNASATVGNGGAVVENGALTVSLPENTVLIASADVAAGAVQSGIAAVDNDSANITIAALDNANVFELTLNVSQTNTTLVEVAYNVGAGRDISKVFHNDVELPNSDNGGEYFEYDANTGILTLYIYHASYITIFEGDDYYVSSYAALAKAISMADKTIILADDIVFPDGSTIAVDLGKDIDLDLNGYSISATDNTDKSYAVITNKGNLTICGPGKISTEATINRKWNNYSSVISNTVGGNLTLRGGVVLEHLGGTDMAYGLDNLTNGKGTSAIATIEDATVKSTYRAVRQFLNGVEAANELYVKAGAEIIGANKSIWMQDPSANANTGKLVVEDGAELYGNVYLYVTAGSTEWPVEVAIADSALVAAEIMTGNVPVGKDVVLEDGVWSVAQVMWKEDGTYFVKGAAGLKAFATEVNNGNTFEGETVKLVGDVDLKNEQWVSIGNEEKPFSGTFDGAGYTIKNLTIVEAEAKEGKAYIGFFGYAKDVTIKNVTFENVNLNIACLDIDHSQGHIGAVAGSLEGTSTIENVTVKGDIKVESTFEANGASRVAVVAGGNSYGNVTMKNVHVIGNEGSYLKANNNVGALAGQLQGVCVFEDCSSNIDVTGCKFFAGGIIGLAAGDSTFTNCHTTGDIAVVAGRSGRGNDHYRVGGIAGGWADGKTKVCTLDDCSYSGELSGTNADGSVATYFDYAGFVGRGYTINGCGGSKVIIDGTEYVQIFDNVHGVYTVDGVAIVYTADALISVFENGMDFVLGCDIELPEDTIFTVNGGKELSIDLAGKTLKAASTGNSGNKELFLVKGTLSVQNGTVTYEHKGDNMGWNAMTTLFDVTAGGVLNLNDVVAKNLGGSDMGFVAHLNNWGEVTLNADGCELVSPYVAVRVFNSGYDMNNVSIKNSTLEGNSNCFWVHNYTVADFGTEEKANAQKALLNLDIFNGTNTFNYTGKGAVRYGMTNSIYLDENGNSL